MPLNLAPVTDYQSMLNRIFWFTSAAALAATWLLRANVPALDAALSKIDVALAIGGDKVLPTPAGYLLPALVIGFATRIFRLHTRVSDLLGIREWFDLDVILREFAEQLDVNINKVDFHQLRRARAGLMRNVFYSYVSGPRPAVDEPLIHQALDAWSWFWIGVETTLLFSLAAFGLIACGVREVGLQTLGATLVLAIIGLPAIRSQCRRYAIAQVRAILADPTRAAAVRAAFAELTGEKINPVIPRRVAA